MIYDQLYVSRHIKSNATGGVFLSSCTFKDYARRQHSGKSFNLLKCVCHASLSFIDPFNNPIIKLICYVLKKLICLTPVAMRRRSVY